MANRAYLYAREESVFRRLYEEHTAPWYYDSRHYIPFSWFFFFMPEDVKLIGVDVSHDPVLRSLPGQPHVVEEVRLICKRPLALDRFARRRQLLEALVCPSLDPSEISELVRRVQLWTGEYLAVNPDEVLGGGCLNSPESAVEAIRSTIDQIERGVTLLSHYQNNLGYLGLDPIDGRDRFTINIVGCTYGEL